MWLSVLVACATTLAPVSPQPVLPDDSVSIDTEPSEATRCAEACIDANQMRAVAAEQIAADCAQACDSEAAGPGLATPHVEPDQP
ncbi:MAG: hypothetical protein P8R54_31015 [Myxococcota bacterium]|nr:hypothetical protein [Myxococcota bacterium]